MRRPAQHPTSPAAPGWAHPYLGTQALATFYNDGGQGAGTSTPPAGAVPSPAEVAARAAQQPPASQAAPPAPTGDEEKVSLTQRRLNVIMRDEKEEGRRAAYRAVAEAAGLDPDTFDPAKFGDIFKQAEAARQQQLSEEQRRAEELTAREQALADREAKAQKLAEDAARRDRDTRIRSALVSLGATGDDLEDAAALLRVPDDATDEQITEAAQQLKERRGVLFGSVAPQTLPPAPSGGPAGGNAPRQPASTKDAVREAARKRARDMGLRTDDAA
ncbi:hypothetical protein [Streptomyces violaceus]|uniref:Scaffolding protein n=1 Tax=Streptomyces violaceus TaxID=1936 RepID=A0ABY9UMR1_STRVL|nr:hypothetical protein [Streptomyces janthinus]WND24103.1 hypothetical protein RI060_43060 [Streptomyces janthinus]GGS96161.1 hypothetical protein GCM10010270_80150 [Streptomyces janthinus]